MLANISNEFLGEFQIILSTIFFGLSLVGQRYAMVDGKIGPITYNAARYFLSTIFLLLLRPIMHRLGINTSMVDQKQDDDEDEDDLSTTTSDIENNIADGDEYHANEENENDSASEESYASEDDYFVDGLLIWISLAVLSNFGGSTLQQLSLQTVSASKVGFITGSYVVIIPFMEWILPFYHHGKLTIKVWMGALLCFVGLFLISGCTSASSCFDLSDGDGEILLLVSVLFWVVCIMSSDVASKRVDCLLLSIGECAIVSVFATCAAIIFEPASFNQTVNVLCSNAVPIAFVALTEGLAYFVSYMGQRYVPPSRTAILFSGGQALCTCVFGFLFLGEKMSALELFGGLLLLSATLVSSSAAADEEEEIEEEREDVRRLHESEFEILHRIHDDAVDVRKPRSYSLQYYPLLDDVTAPIKMQPQDRFYGSVEMVSKSF